MLESINDLEPAYCFNAILNICIVRIEQFFDSNNSDHPKILKNNVKAILKFYKVD